MLRKFFMILTIITFSISCGENGGDAPLFELEEDQEEEESTEATCGGRLSAGYCWYFATYNTSCTTYCSTRGGVNAATTTYVGSGGTDFNCETIMSELGTNSSSSHSANCPAGYGCYYAPSEGTRRCAGPTTNASAAPTDGNRICACNR